MGCGPRGLRGVPSWVGEILRPDKSGLRMTRGTGSGLRMRLEVSGDEPRPYGSKPVKAVM